jgi:cell division protein FtsW (lipid II flippase)
MYSGAFDFIFVAILEELGAVIGFAVLILFAVLLLRILRMAVLLPTSQVFERLRSPASLSTSSPRSLLWQVALNLFR